MSTTSILQEFSFPSPTLPGTSSTSTIACALCGTCILPPTPDLTSMNGLPKPPSHPLSSLTMSRSTNGIQSTKSWSGFLTKTTSLTSYASTPQTSVPSSPPPSPPTQVYVFRVSTPPATNSLPPPTLSANPIRTTHSQIYPLCKSGWCLSRLRTTCSLWSFVRTGIVEKIWEEELPREPVVNKVKEKEVVEANKKEDGVVAPADGEKADAKPPVPPRRRGLWERASSIASTALGMEKEKEKEKKLPLTPPPTHPSLPPHVDPKSADPGPQLPAAAPPPLPKRSQIRERERTRSTMGTPTEEIPALNGSTSEIGSPRPSTDEKPTIHVNGLTGHGQDDSTDHGPSAMSSLPSTLSESTSQEHFSTPTEEFASLPSTPFATSPTPTPAPPSVAESTPLPSSVPSTPTPDDTFAKAIQNSSPARTASPAPPPVPRRAAARARPLSISTPRSGTPVPESVQESVPAPAPSEPSKPEVDVFTMADVQPVQDQDEASVDNKTITQSTKEETPTLTESAAISEAKPSEDGSDNGSSDSEASSLEMYVGTATWEERSWKEITRLREDMFWARIGCVR
ncbi:hypothetical protein JAAARDRAFT_671720 [Jaapia argillacea MUCL 33604]|uniref:Uncharacterized protein n=1 Tax=Jaapia argillacea MUCL 33604 TaxID=933084 RepID=A0A067Q7H1_9AGAM|nr:hypothetical protein JAAARDRAFT_671720 [Jaapia argillacea MUCL 33604]